MAARLMYALAVLVCLALTAGADSQDESQRLKLDASNFAVETYQQSNALKPNKNIATAGSFLWILLNLLTLGTLGDSRWEIKVALGLERDGNDYLSRIVIPLTLGEIKKIKGLVLEHATRYFIKDDGVFTTDYFDVDAYRYGVEVEPLNLTYPDKAAHVINTWVHENTHGKIRGLISATDLGPDSSLILIDSVFIKTTWETAFDVTKTKQRPFNLADGSSIYVDTMEITGDFRYGYYKYYDAEVLVLPLKGNEASVIFVLPKKKDGLPNLIEKLDKNGTELFISALKIEKERVKVSIPKCLIETTTNLKTLLPKLGVNLILKRGKSGLKYILDSGEEVSVTTAVQKTIFVVDEKGENDSDVYDGFGGALSFLFISPYEFHADRPYLAAVVPNKGPIISISQITNPSLRASTI